MFTKMPTCPFTKTTYEVKIKACLTVSVSCRRAAQCGGAAPLNLRKYEHLWFYSVIPARTGSGSSTRF